MTCRLLQSRTTNYVDYGILDIDPLSSVIALSCDSGGIDLGGLRGRRAGDFLVSPT